MKEPSETPAQATDIDAEIHEVHDLQRLKDLLQQYGKPAAIAAAVVLAATLALTMYRGRVEAANQAASQMLFSAQSIQALDSIVTEHPKSDAAPLALLKLAKVYFDSGNYGMALDKYAGFLSEHPAHTFAAGAELGIVHCKEARGQIAEALQGFQTFIREHPDHYLAPQALFGQVRCLEQLGRHEEARILCENFLAANPESAWAFRAQEMLDGINAKLERQQDTPGGPAQAIPKVVEQVLSE